MREDKKTGLIVLGSLLAANVLALIFVLGGGSKKKMKKSWEDAKNWAKSKIGKKPKAPDDED